MTLCVTDTRGSHSELTGEFAAIRYEMESVAACLGGKVLGQVKEQEFWTALHACEKPAGIVLFCVQSTILKRMPAHWPSGMPWSAGISMLSCS